MIFDHLWFFLKLKIQNQLPVLGNVYLFHLFTKHFMPGFSVILSWWYIRNAKRTIIISYGVGWMFLFSMT